MGLLERLRQRATRTDRRTRVAGDVAGTEANPDRALRTGERHEPQHAGPRFAVIDVETTGLSAANHRILEIAVVTTNPTGAVLDAWSTRLNPEGPVGATHIHGITDRDVARAPLFRDVIPHLNSRLAGAAICAHNARFDLAFLRAEYARAGWQMPFVPSLCTLEASTHHLPQLHRRRLSDVCEALGVQQQRAHSALDDATAAAGLLAAFLHPGRPPRQSDLALASQGHAVRWPAAGVGHPLLVQTGADRQLSERARHVMGAATAAKPPKPLVQLISRFSLIDALKEGAPAGAVAYLEKLAEVFEDGVLEPAEADALHEVAATYELSAADVASAHRAFTTALAREAVADGKITRAERAELGAIADALEVPATDIAAILKDAATDNNARLGAALNPLPDGWHLGEPLRVGDRVVFTGCNPDERAALETASEKVGVRIMSGVAKTTAVLVTDGSMHGGKAQKAAELGTRTVTPDTYRQLLAHLQPAKATPAATGPQRTVASPDVRAPTLRSPAQNYTAEPSTRNPRPAQVRAWGRANGWEVGERGRLPAGLLDAYREAHPDA